MFTVSAALFLFWAFSSFVAGFALRSWLTGRGAAEKGTETRAERHRAPLAPPPVETEKSIPSTFLGWEPPGPGLLDRGTFTLVRWDDRFGWVVDES